MPGLYCVSSTCDIMLIVTAITSCCMLLFLSSCNLMCRDICAEKLMKCLGSPGHRVEQQVLLCKNEMNVCRRLFQQITSCSHLFLNRDMSEFPEQLWLQELIKGITVISCKMKTVRIFSNIGTEIREQKYLEENQEIIGNFGRSLKVLIYLNNPSLSYPDLCRNICITDLLFKLES